MRPKLLNKVSPSLSTCIRHGMELHVRNFHSMRKNAPVCDT